MSRERLPNEPGPKCELHTIPREYLSAGAGVIRFIEQLVLTPERAIFLVQRSVAARSAGAFAFRPVYPPRELREALPQSWLWLARFGLGAGAEAGWMD